MMTGMSATIIGFADDRLYKIQSDLINHRTCVTCRKTTIDYFEVHDCKGFIRCMIVYILCIQCRWRVAAKCKCNSLALLIITPINFRTIHVNVLHSVVIYSFVFLNGLSILQLTIGYSYE